MGQLSVSGSLQGGPAGSGDTFPAAKFITPLKMSTEPKGFQRASGILTRLFDDAATFVECSAVGTGRDVPRANTLYMKGSGDYDVRLTQEDGSGGSTTVIVPCHGLVILEFPDTKALTLLEVRASTTIEYFASGP